jgi:hypothetical protein
MKTFILLMLFLTSLLTGCSNSSISGNKKSATATNYLSQVASPGCLAPASINNTLTPPVLYQGMVSCIKGNNANNGILLYALAGTYSYFDALRLDTDEARQAHSAMLGEALKMVSKDQQQAFWRTLNDRFSDKNQLAAVCRQVQRIGKPVYAPAYLSLPPGGGAAGQENAFWNNAMNGYLHCATDVLSIR